MTKTALRYCERACLALDTPAWVAPVLYQLLLVKAADGRIYSEDTTREKISRELELTRNAVNQAIFQLVQHGLLARQGRALLPRLDVFPNIDYEHLHKAKLVIEVDSHGEKTYLLDAE